MKTCPPATDLSALLDGRLDDAATAAVSAHLERCRACRSAIEDLSADPDSRRWAELRADTTLAGPTPGFLNHIPKRSSRGSTSIARVAGAADESTIPAGHAAPPGYEILGYLGRGGMGVVYKARHLALKRTVALKMLRPETVADAEQRARLIGEAETVARLHHPNIAQVYEVGEQNGVPYLALEFIEGPTLAQAMDGKPVPPRAAAGLVATLARAAHHAHTLGVVHRDLKPGNILLGNDQCPMTNDQSGSSLVIGHWSLRQPKVTDFGLAKRLDEIGQTQSGQVLGTPCYMAPEQARGASGAITPLADVYALGAVLYELLTGRPPLVGQTTLDTVIRVLNDEPARPRGLNPGVPVDLETVCLRCLEKDPRRRYASAAALADDLDRFLAGEPVLARPLSRPVRAWRWARRHPTTATLLALVLVVAAVGFPAATALWLDARAKERDAVEAEGRARDAENEAVRARNAIARQSAGLLADRGFTLADAGDFGPGLHHLTMAVRVCPAEAEDDAFRTVIRDNIAAYASLLPRPVAALEPTDINCAAFSADGRRVATGHHDGTVRVWDAATGAAVAGPWTHTHAVIDVAFHPDGRSLLVGYGGRPGTAAADGNCWRWDLATGRRVGEPFSLPGGTRVVAWSPDGRRVAVGAGEHVAVWEADPVRRVGGPWKLRLDGPGPAPEVTAVRFTPDGRAIAVAAGRVWAAVGWQKNGEVQFLDAADGRPTTVLRFPATRPERLAVSPDGRFVAAGDWWDTTTVQEFDPATRAAAGGAVRLPGGFGGLAPDGGTVLLAREDGSVRFTDVRTGRPGSALRTPWTSQVTAVDPTGRAFLKDSELWTMPRALSRPAPADPNPAVGAGTPVFAPGAETVATVGLDRSLYFTRTGDGRPDRAPIPGCTGNFAWSADGARVAVGQPGSGGANVRVFDLSAGAAEIARLGHPAQVGGLAFRPDGRQLAVGTYGRVVHLHDLGGPARPPVRLDDIVIGLAYSPDGRRLAAGRSNDWRQAPHVRFIDPATGAFDGGPLPHVKDGVRAVSYNRDGSRLFVTSDVRVRLWDTAARTAVGPTVSVAGRLPGTPFSPDGRWFVCLEAKDGVRIHDADTGAAVGGPVGGPANVTAAAFSPDSRSLLLGHADGTARVYDRATLRSVGPAVAQRHAVQAVAWAADGRAFFTASTAGAVRRWPVPQIHSEDADALIAAVEMLTAARMDAGQAVSPLDRDEWLARYRGFLARHGPVDRVLGPGPAAADWHDARARDAEEEGDAVTAVYHLDRRLAAVPADGTAVLRRMHQHVLMGNRAAAEGDRRRAVESVGRDVVDVWGRHFESVCRHRKQAGAAEWYAAGRGD